MSRGILADCPMCGHAVRVSGTDEGTQHYEPDESQGPAAPVLQAAQLVVDALNAGYALNSVAVDIALNALRRAVSA